METKELKIQTPEGYEIDKENSTFEKIVFKKVESKLPKTWKDLEEISGFYIDKYSMVSISYIYNTDEDNRNIFPTREEAEACLALAQLCQLRDRYNDGWKPDWEDGINKYCIYLQGNKIDCGEVHSLHYVLIFKTEELRDEFLENFRDLIEIAKPLL